MNDNRNIQEAELDRKVQAYFDCMLTAGEERDLGVRLAALSEDRLTGDRREALAAISLATVEHRRAPEKQAYARRAAHPVRKKTIWFAAAAAAVVAMIAMPRIWMSDNSGDECYAYVDGHLVTDKAVISRMVEMQMADMAEAMDDFYNEIPLNPGNYQLVISN